eukprot:1189553-Rhodomonas_salina.3
MPSISQWLFGAELSVSVGCHIAVRDQSTTRATSNRTRIMGRGTGQCDSLSVRHGSPRPAQGSLRHSLRTWKGGS